jgi:hypothetical protein
MRVLAQRTGTVVAGTRAMGVRCEWSVAAEMGGAYERAVSRMSQNHAETL